MQAIVTARLVLLDIVFQHLLCTAMPTTHSMSPVEEKHDYIRREILEILKRSIMPAAISLETITVSTLLVLLVRILDILTKHT